MGKYFLVVMKIFSETFRSKFHLLNKLALKSMVNLKLKSRGHYFFRCKKCISWKQVKNTDHNIVLFHRIRKTHCLRGTEFVQGQKFYENDPERTMVFHPRCVGILLVMIMHIIFYRLSEFLDKTFCVPQTTKTKYDKGNLLLIKGCIEFTQK